MGKKLIIAEKPSVAADIARALGGFKRQDDYFESDDYVVSSAVGHLLELTAPDGYEVKRGKWSFANLPVIPPHFDLRPIEKSEPRLKLLTKLLKRKDIDAIINACDAGREGELIFRYIMRHAKVTKPSQRLWLQSMTPAAIRDGFEHLRADRELLPLADAATCRSESDWLIGINGTRALTAFNSKSGGFHKTPVGRVQTPTLAILVEREEKIKKFISRDYWEVHARFGVAGGEYEGRWFDEKFSKAEREEDVESRAERLWDQKRAEEIRKRCDGQPGKITEESKPSTQLSPLLFDLTSLQRAANGRFGFSARMTLSVAQSLYEKHKALTYPRTDSRALPEDYPATVKETLAALVGEKGASTVYAPFARKVLAQDWVKPNKRIFNNAKVSDHFAIIPTAVQPKNLNEAETKLYDLVVRRFLAVFYPAAEYLITTRITRLADEPFKSEGKVLKQAGWLEVHGKEVAEDDAATLVPVKAKEDAKALEVNVVPNQTKPPARFTEATLLTAMEGAGKLVEDEELRDAMKERGLGTPATRAVVIEKLIADGYVIRNQRELQPTPKASSLFTLLRGLEIPELVSPELTGEWEFRLKEMEHGKLSRVEFMKGIAEITEHIVVRAKAHESDTVPGDFSTLETPCPSCAGVIKENYKKFQCQSCDFALWRILSGRQFEPAEIEALIREGQIGPLQGFRSRMGKPFAAIIKLTPEFKLEFDFGQQQGGIDGAAVDFTGQEPLGPCPKCGARVFDAGMAYVCEKAVETPRACDFRSGKIILQRPIEVEQMGKLLNEGKTDLLHRFISKKGRPFSAYLVRGADGKVTFEFEPRAAAKTPKAAAAVKAAPAKAAPKKAPAKARKTAS